MRFPPLLQARLIRRYKRFLSDMRLPDGREVVAHCPNPGSMLGLAPEGARCWLEPNDDPKKKLGYSWKLVEPAPGTLVAVDTGLANRVVAEALATGAVPDLAGYATIRAEVPYGAGSRVDFLLSDPTRGEALVEVKSVTLSRGGWAEFPDSVTKRGTKHLQELAREAQAGRRAVMLYLVSRSDGTRVRIAADIDPAYAMAFDAARAAGVEMLALGTEVSPEGVRAARALPVA
ncbi:XRE family transcriptional regulator [Defluviimonas sp. 20V17]|uniref:Sugar fermentation stimulation protein homolog n=1 Tax=Allgaiera indica TaxID=765699 RepID=A0AAN4UNH6_9RHOB|nr:DNA/RNA nuclease SfsA [Allgaiera indica]KDB03574.1 XRE family transcriptional regulator [Defluviimonas sp. 20V17]GHD98362.1 sugar fermentation stimulation protein [Allgaiera indica]SDW48731.1 sugar fermentation stimulation protein A [Allgaiera indica]